MKTVSNFNEVEKFLADFTPPVRMLRIKYDLTNMISLMDYLGNPQEDYKIIHVAGTSGKTSTTYYIAALLKILGKKVGHTVSPHVDDINERVQINLLPLSEKEFCSEFNEFIKVLEKAPIRPTYFEFMIAFACWEFKRQNVDYAVIEVGLGGIGDATNVIKNKEKVSVITDIGFDHQNILGNTLEEIAAQKIGILLPGSDGICLEQDSEILEVFKDTAASLNADIKIFKQQDLPQLKSLPLYQQRNWYLADKVVQFLIQRDNLQPLTEEQKTQSLQTYIPARMEIIKKDNKTYILDAAHNPQKMEALVNSLKNKYPGQKFTVLLSLLKSRDFKLRGVLENILPITEQIIVTEFVAGQDLKKFSTPADEINKLCIEMGFTKTTPIKDSGEAIKKLETTGNGPFLITGSFYLLHDIHKDLRSK